MKLIFCIIVLVKIDCLLGRIFTTNSDRKEDASFWRQDAAAHLRLILSQLKADHIPLDKMHAKNVIIFVGDGMGMSTITAGRIFKGQKLYGVSGEEQQLSFDRFPYVGLAKTYTVDRQVPDSAGTATALFTGVKTNSGVVGMDAIESRTKNLTSNGITTIMDWAQEAGKRTGFVTTTRVTHATPAALYAKSLSRDWECDTSVPVEQRKAAPDQPDIARQLIEKRPGNRINVILAGGRSMMGRNETEKNPFNEPQFNGNTEKACYRTDGRDLIAEWLALDSSKRQYVQNKAELLAVDDGEVENLLGLFSHNHLSFNAVRTDRPTGQPSLTEMTEKAIKILQRNPTKSKKLRSSDRGFVLMVEGGRIDQAHHQNHARLALEELLEMDRAIERALQLTNRSDTLLIVTADHSHAFTLNGYPLRGNDILGFANKTSAIQPYETLTYANGPGFWKHRLQNSSNETWIKVDELTPEYRMSPLYQHQAMLPLHDDTHGGEDVQVYAIGAGAPLIRGTFEQNYVAYAMGYVGRMGPAASITSAATSVYVSLILVFVCILVRFI